MSAGNNENGKRFWVVCYYGSWAHWRPATGRLGSSDINPFLCTHLIYSFLRINPSNFSVSSNDPYLDLEGGTRVGSFNRILALRHKNPQLKVMISVGGWNEGSQLFSNMSLTPGSRKVFIRSLVNFLDDYPFDGVDIDWEYPAQRDGRPEDRKNFLSLLKELRSAFDQKKDKKMILSAAVAATKYIASKSYDIPALNELLDFVNIMTYDYFGPWTYVVGHNAPLFHRKQAAFENADLSVNASITQWITAGMDARKILMGIPMYGRTFTLRNASDHEPFALSDGEGIQGNVSQIRGTLSYYEACQLEQEEGRSFWAKDWQAPFLVRGDQWISYENSRSVKAKADYIREQGLAGAMIWSLDHDDITGVCGEGRMPLTSVVSQTLMHLQQDGKRGSTMGKQQFHGKEGAAIVRKEEEEVADSDYATPTSGRTLTVSSTASNNRALRILLITLVNSTYLIRRSE